MNESLYPPSNASQQRFQSCDTWAYFERPTRWIPGIKSFPKFLLYSPLYEWSEEYPKDRLKELGKPKDAMGEDIVEWVREMLPPFTPGFAHMLGGGSSAAAGKGVLSGREQLLEWRGPWLLLCVRPR